VNQRPAQSLSDLTDAWPEEAGNEELARVGQELFADRPALPQIALDRIQVQMRREIGRVERARKWRRLVLGLLGCIAIAVGLWGWLHPRKTGTVGNNTAPAEQPAVRDTFEVTLPPTPPNPPEKPLVDLDRYKGLFGKDAKESER
jgi:hypothetical protein